MIYHGGNRTRGTTSCGKPLARRWWVPDEPYESHGIYGGLRVMTVVDQRHEIDCLACKKALKLGYYVERLTNPEEQVGMPMSHKWAIMSYAKGFVDAFQYRASADTEVTMLELKDRNARLLAANV